MTEAKTATANGLYEALARLQADLPPVGKDQKADAGTYSYKYADLAAVSHAVMPLMGKFGLSFIARPTMLDGRFVLAYSLVHSSGEREDGIYPLGNGTPQQMGSLITYARRYCLCAVTGLVAGGDDDDGAAAQQAAQAAGSAWDSAAPARPRQQQAAPSGDPQWETAPASGGNGQPAEDKAAAAQAIADEASQAQAVMAISELHSQAHDTGLLTATIRDPVKGLEGKLSAYLTWRRCQLAAEAKATAELIAAGMKAGLEGDALDARVQQITGSAIEGATVKQLEQATAELLASVKEETPA